MLETRFVKSELRAEGGGVIQGTAISYGSRSTDRNLPFVETPDIGCFKKSCQRAARGDGDIICTFNHLNSQVLARTSAHNLEITEDNRGVHYRAQLDLGVSYAADLYRNVVNRNVVGNSFSFEVDPDGDEWEDIDPDEMDEDDNRFGLRHLRSARLLSVDPVVCPAYENSTSVVARSVQELFPCGISVEMRSRYPKLEDQIKLAKLLKPETSANERAREAARRSLYSL
jgi:HK97 family phage prohead protease